MNEPNNDASHGHLDSRSHQVAHPELQGAHRTPVQLRFSDTDMLGHINNAVFATYAESARLDFLTHIGFPLESLILAHLRIDFLRQVHLGSNVIVETQIERVGRSSLTLKQRVLADEEQVGDVQSVVVLFDYAKAEPKAIPEEWRQRLERLTS